MRWFLIVLAVVGITASSLALREHYRTDDNSPCNINDHWDCGIVNHSPFAMIAGIPVAVIGITGYLLLGALAFKKAFRLMLVATLGGLAFSLYLARIEAYLLGVWCIYCAISLGVISLMSLLVLGKVLVSGKNRSNEAAQA